jgi:hypothetical protein
MRTHPFPKSQGMRILSNKNEYLGMIIGEGKISMDASNLEELGIGLSLLR